MSERILEKHECLDYEGCGASFLVDKERAKDMELNCPFCGYEAQPVAYSSPIDMDEQEVMGQLSGCLYPS